MAAPVAMSVDEDVYCAISNIPQEFHSKDLRNYFSQFLEVGGFDCFHFKHRPERKIEGNEGVNDDDCDSTATGASLAVAKQAISTSYLAATAKALNKVSHISYKTYASSIPGQATGKTSKAQTKTRKETFATTCCVIKLHEPNVEKLLKMYRMKNWVDSCGSTMSQQCHICRVEVIADNIEPVAPSKQTFVRGNRMEAASFGGSMLRSKLMKLPELNPPDIMPHGNVGTPTSLFNQLIRECRLPPKVISRLGIVFPKSRTNKRYGNVPLRYDGDVVTLIEEKEELVETSQGHTIFQTSEAQAPSRRKTAATEETKLKKTGNTKEDSPSTSEADDSGEEWDRHEALHNDVTNQERTTERLFENDVEVTWDKGSSGLVFYTDAAYWDKQEGDFDEKTCDDWDVDMSVYDDPNGGDKDARDFITMRREQRLLKGLDSTRVFQAKKEKKLQQKEKMERKKMKRKQRLKEAQEERMEEDQKRGIGEFEKHTKGIGRKILEAQGWIDGEGLGKTRIGINQALHNEGQGSHDKRGFGYFGEKLSGKQTQKKKRKQQHSGERQVIISTIYDDPKVNDPDEPLLRSQGPYQLKYRDEVLFAKASVTDT